MAAYILPDFLSAVRAVAARCKLPFALRPGLSQEDKVRTKEITNESNKGKVTIPYSSSAGAMKEGACRNSGSSSPVPNSPAAPSSSASAPRSSFRSRRSQSSHSDEQSMYNELRLGKTWPSSRSSYYSHPLLFLFIKTSRYDTEAVKCVRIRNRPISTPPH